MTLPVTALAAAICALLLIFLKFQVIGQRIRTGTMFGAGQDEKMKMVRGAHANLAENAPIALILMALLEMTSAHHWTLTGLAAMLLIARGLHIYGMYQHHRIGRGARRHGPECAVKTSQYPAGSQWRDRLVARDD